MYVYMYILIARSMNVNSMQQIVNQFKTDYK